MTDSVIPNHNGVRKRRDRRRVFLLAFECRLDRRFSFDNILGGNNKL
jgi:hypothetical protein